jgi:hypothetical protein
MIQAHWRNYKEKTNKDCTLTDDDLAFANDGNLMTPLGTMQRIKNGDKTNIGASG